MRTLLWVTLWALSGARAQDEEAAPVSLSEVRPGRVIETTSPPPAGPAPSLPSAPPAAPAPPSPPKAPAPPRVKIPVSWEEAERLIGKRATLGGTVVATFKTKRYILLHFHKDHPDYFAVMIPRSELWKFPKNPQDFYMGKQVLVDGLIVRRDGRPVVYVRDRSRIWVVGEALRGKLPPRR